MKSRLLTARPQRKQRVLKQEAEGTVVLLDVDSGRYYALDEVGGRVWDLCDGRRTVAEIAATIGEEYVAAAETIQRDLGDLLRELADESLLQDNTPAMASDPGGL